jgi:hypothetical protein
VIKVTFEGESIRELYHAMERFLEDVMEDAPRARALEQAAPPPEVTAKPEKKQDAKPDAKERMAKARAAKVAKKKPEPEQLPKAAIAKPQITPEAVRDEVAMRPEKFEDLVLEPDPIDEPETIDPVNLAALRVKTTEDLQAAYSSGKHKQVLALLSKFGNGAKSFRELQIQDFVPIRKAIDDGALA